MVSDDKEIFLIDWDDSLFSPKEKDLTMIKDDLIKLDGYKSIIGNFEINEDVVNFYNMKWNLSEIEDWSSRILSSEENDIQNQHYLEEFISELEDLMLT